MFVKILGCATSTGVPIAGCTCNVCTSNDSKNKRTRCSLYIESNGKNILIDTSTDLRQQALTNNITRIDLVLYTHSHADHTHGIDDLRTFNFINKMEIPCYGNEFTINNIKSNFKYIFDSSYYAGGKPKINLNIIENDMDYHGTLIEPVDICHGEWTILGYKINNMAYLTDCSKIPERSKVKLTDLDILIISALRYRKHPAHLNVSEAVELVKELNPKTAVLTHMGHELEYNDLLSKLPDNIEPAYDGMSFNLEY